MELSDKRREQLTLLIGVVIFVEALVGAKLLFEGETSSATVVFSTIMMWSSAMVLLNSKD